MTPAQLYKGIDVILLLSEVFDEQREQTVDVFVSRGHEFDRRRTMIGLAKLATNIIYTLEEIHEQIGNDVELGAN